MGIIKLAYFREGRTLRKCKIIFSGGRVRIIVYPEVQHLIVRLKGQLSVRELQTLLSNKGERVVEFRVNDVKSVVKYGLRRTRKFQKLFPEEIKGNIAEVLITLPHSTLCLLLMEGDAAKLIRYLKS